MLHSSQYKSPKVNQLENKTVMVVGSGNSGVEIATNLSPVNKKVYVISRNGQWIIKQKSGELFWPLSTIIFERLFMTLSSRFPWWMTSAIAEKFILNQSQKILNQSGMKPKHRWAQQHPYGSGIRGERTLHDEIERGAILCKKWD